MAFRPLALAALYFGLALPDSPNPGLFLEGGPMVCDYKMAQKSVPFTRFNFSPEDLTDSGGGGGSEEGRGWGVPLILPFFPFEHKAAPTP